MSEKHSGPEAFRERYSELFGDRWPALESALAAESDSVAFVASEGRPPYYLDSGSVFAASSLEMPAEGLVFDACAAPGGKSLVLASRLSEGSRLVANELSADRRRRLREVLDEHLEPALRERVEVWGKDAAAMCRSREAAFDAILLDAPCSSERHVLSDPSALRQWSPARIRGLAVRQWALLASALIMLKEGGRLVYSTCALSSEENDLVVRRAAAKYGDSIAFEPPVAGAPAGAEETAYGLSILPDRCGGAGPMYVSRIRKRA
jgi:tRNA and rRNA cytosine-C5-methylases